MGWFQFSFDWFGDRLRHPGDWLPLALSIVATAISILAYRRGAPPILPRIWLSYKRRGKDGVTIWLYVENHTAHPIRVESIRPKDKAMKIAKPPQVATVPGKPWVIDYFPEVDWQSELSIDADVSPNGSFDTGIVLPITDTSVMVSPSMHLCISTMRRTIRKRTIVVPIIIPAAI